MENQTDRHINATEKSTVDEGNNAITKIHKIVGTRQLEIQSYHQITF